MGDRLMARDWTQEYFGINENTPVSSAESSLKRKLKIAVKALETYANNRTWDCCHRNHCAYVDGFEAAEALRKIKEFK